MTKLKKVLTLQIPVELATALDAEKKRSGVSFSEIVRRAIQEYLETKKREEL